MPKKKHNGIAAPTIKEDRIPIVARATAITKTNAVITFPISSFNITVFQAVLSSVTTISREGG